MCSSDLEYIPYFPNDTIVEQFTYLVFLICRTQKYLHELENPDKQLQSNFKNILNVCGAFMDWYKSVDKQIAEEMKDAYIQAIVLTTPLTDEERDIEYEGVDSISDCMLHIHDMWSTVGKLNLPKDLLSDFRAACSFAIGFCAEFMKGLC